MKKCKNQTKYTTWGFLRMVSLSTISRTTERCTAGRSAFSALNSVVLRFGCLHPVTSRRLYSTLCLPIVLHGSELWSLSNTKLNILECIHHKILAMHHPRPSKQMLNNSPPELIGSCSISSFITQRQLTCIKSSTCNLVISPSKFLK